MADEHIHRVGDGRGRRAIYVNGNEIPRAVWADTNRGVVVYYPQPVRIHKLRRDEVFTRKLKGVVTVEFLHEVNNG